MATLSSGATPDRRTARRQATIEEALDQAVAIMTEQGVGALTVSEIARRMGMRGPSLYKYFPSLHDVYDRLFARGQAANRRAIHASFDTAEPGIARIRSGTRATVRWCVENPALAQLLYWRVVPGFRPSEEAFVDAVQSMAELRSELAGCVRAGELAPSADSETAARMLTVLISGLVTQQLANEPGAGFDSGRFTALTDEAIDLFLHHHRPRRP